MTKLKALLVVLGLAALLLAGASLPHLHASSGFALWNEEHDLGLMATHGNAASPVDAAPVAALVLTVVLALVPSAERPASAPLRLSPPRAPPAR